MYALIIALVVSLLLGPKVIEKLKELRFGQVIRKWGPETHYSKEGTPTMGGLLIIFCVLLSIFIFGDLYNSKVLITVFALVSFGILGFWDDYTKIVKKNPDGIGAKKKFVFQLILSLVISILIVHCLKDKGTLLQLPFFKRCVPDLGYLYIPFAILVITGTSNAVNLTDGLDGLAIVPVCMCTAAYGIIAYLAGNAHFARYLNIMYIPGAGELTVVAAAVVGAGLGFLWFNAYPAEVFMGDTGSLALGAALGVMSLLTKHELLLPIFGGIFVIEALSVIIQVSYFKATGGKRVFRMAPIHHHFEKQGLPEPKIIIRFWIISLIFVLIGLSTLKVR